METKGINVIEAVDRMEIAYEEPHPSLSTDNDSGTEGGSQSADALSEVFLMLDILEEELGCSLKSLNGALNDSNFKAMLTKLMMCEKNLLEQFLSTKSNRKLKITPEFIETYLNKVSRILIKLQQEALEKDMYCILPETRIKNFLDQLAMATDNFEGFSEDSILQLLSKQFHGINTNWCGNVVKNHLKIIPDMKGSTSLLYSCALLSTKTERVPMGKVEVNHEDRKSTESATHARVGLLGNMTSMNAKNCLLRAPMLCDIGEWSQWGLIFGPTLGPLLDWLEQENLYRELVCLVTRQGSILRIDGLATVDALLAVAVKGLGKETALQLVSLVAVYGGADRVPHALLITYLSKAIEVMLENGNAISKKRKERDEQEIFLGSKKTKGLLQSDAHLLSREKAVANTVIDEASDSLCQVAEFIMDVLMHIPSEFVDYASRIVVPALCRTVPNARSAMLNCCSSFERKIRLCEVGIASGITDWVMDFQMLLSQPYIAVNKETKPIPFSGDSMDPGARSSIEVATESTEQKEATGMDTKISAAVGNTVPMKISKNFADVVHGDKEAYIGIQESEAQQIISNIRKEEFGMDLELTSKEINLLAKQHARMGRALQRLSRELYSQDSHYVLELVQNADDNQYETDVSPILLFILQKERVIVVNNEHGFTSANMKALCDVGNSTKTGSASGYIGQKGIGFKSVFRVTDSPEIHSNGFHVKFDVSEGTIGFILPTLITPFCDWHKIEGVMLSLERNTNYGKQTWNTCIVLPLKQLFVNGPNNQVLSIKFGDVHPSLLLFLRRLCCIAIKDDVRGTMRVMQRYNMKDGLVRVSDNESVSYWLVVKQELDARVDRPGVKTTEIALAFPLQEVSPGYFEACNEYQQVFSFLPLRSYCLRFIIQGDFVLPSSREDLDTDNPWNQWLLSEIPGVCLRALESFKTLSCFDGVVERAASAFLSFLPHEGEVQGFFSSLPRMIFAILRTSACLPVDGTNNEWALPCILLGGWDEAVKNLLPGELLWGLLGLRYLHKGVCLSSILASELGIRVYGYQVLLDFLEHLCSREDVLKTLGATWVGLWLIAFDRCLTNESQNYTRLIHGDAVDRVFKKLHGFAFIPLSNGTFTSLNEGPLWLPSHDVTDETGSADLLRQFPLLYADMRMVDAQLIGLDSIDNQCVEPLEEDMLAVRSEERTQLLSVLRRLGICQISEHKVVTLHALPTVTNKNARISSDSLLMECLAFVMVHLQSDCSHCKTERPRLLDELRTNAFMVTRSGLKRVNEEPLHFGLEFGCPADVCELLQGLQIRWTEVDPSYLQTFKSWTKAEACLKWRAFLKELGVTDFVKLEPVEKVLQAKATSIWKEVLWEGFDGGDQMAFIRDWECSEAVQILEELCNSNMDISVRGSKCAQFVSMLDCMWEETYSNHVATYWRGSSPDSSPQGITLPSFILRLRSFAWIQSSFDGMLYQPKDLFYRCSAVESLLGDNAPYCRPQLKSANLAVAIGLQTIVTVPQLRYVLKIWSRVPIHTSVEQMTKLYTWLWTEMGEDIGTQQFLQSENSVFIPDIAVNKERDLVWGKFMHPKNLVWRDETGCLSFIMSTGTCLRDGFSYRALDPLYPTLQPFFMRKCHVRDTLCFKEYHNVLRMIARNYNPRTALDKVLNVFTMWSDNIKSGQVGTMDLSAWREHFQTIDSKVFPTVQNNWVSLHRNEGIVCWCDDETLGKMFLGSTGVHYICVDMAAFDLSQKVDEIISAKRLGPFLQAMDIQSLSKVVVREAIPKGAQICKYLMELFNWALPYVQRYLQKLHPNIYRRLQNGLISERLNNLTCYTCNQLFFCYKLHGKTTMASERVECNYLLEGDNFYSAEMDDLNGIFLEFSKLFFDGSPNPHLGNFLHLITLSVQSGSDEKEIESLLASQGIESFLESVGKWTLRISNGDTMPETSKKVTETYITDVAPRTVQRFSSNSWPPRSLQHVRKKNYYNSPHSNKLTTCQRSLNAVMKEIELKKGCKPQKDAREPDKNNEEIGATSTDSRRDDILTDLVKPDGIGEQVSFPDREQLAVGQPSEQQQELTGRLGEAVVYNHLLEIHGPDLVKWMNAETESGLPYDIVLGVNDGKGRQQLVEVKSTWTEGKDWFEMSPHEWEIACRLGDRFVIVRVFLAGGASARFLWLPNPSQLCQQRLVKLALVLPNQNYTQGLAAHSKRESA